MSFHLCMLHVDEQHCGIPSEWFLPIKTKVLVFSEEEQINLIQNYARMDQSMQAPELCKIGVGYNNCKDVIFQAIDIITALQSELDFVKEIKPTAH